MEMKELRAALDRGDRQLSKKERQLRTEMANNAELKRQLKFAEERVAELEAWRERELVLPPE
jgi:hypothetical protein